jgi:hypothetical protein
MRLENEIPDQLTEEWTVNPCAMNKIMMGHRISSKELSLMTSENCTRGDGVSTSEINNFRRGGRVRLEDLLMIMNALNLKPSDFFVRL